MSVNEKLPKDALADVRIFVVDDEEILAWSIENELRTLGAEVMRAGSLAQAYERFPSFQADLAICDLKLPDGSGIDLLKKWKTDQPTLPVILITAHGAVDSAISAVRLGAFDYLQKPFDMKSLVAAVKRASEVSQLRQKVSRLEGAIKGKEPVKIIGESPAIKKLRRQLERIARSKTDSVLVHGETGSGKELAARAIHEWSDRSNEPYMEINCASIPENLLESELFGYEKGAFTDARSRKLGLFEMARNGTIFLDEIGELPIKLQAKLLRALEYRRFKRLGGVQDIEFNARIVAATNRDLLQEAADGNFRADLYYRLNVIPVQVPSLKEHKEDLDLLINFFLQKVAHDLGVPKPDISKECLNLLRSHDWPGNVRELRNVLQRAIVLEQPTTLRAEHISIEKSRATTRTPAATNNQISTKDRDSLNGDGEAKGTNSGTGSFTLPEEGISLEDVEKNFLIQALEKAHYNQSKAAQLLNISRHTLRYRLEKYGIAEH